MSVDADETGRMAAMQRSGIQYSMKITRREAVASLRNDVRVGMLQGLLMATTYTVVATAIVVGSGYASELRLPEYLTLVGAYFAAGVMGGATAGALRRHSRSRAAVALTGAAAGLSVFLALGTAAFGSPAGWDRHHWIAYGLGVIVVSPLAAVYYQARVHG